MRRIEDEAQRMGMLVDDLLLLARLDQERPLEQVPVDLRVVGATPSPRRTSSRRRGRSSSRSSPATGPLIVIGDELRHPPGRRRT